MTEPLPQPVDSMRKNPRQARAWATCRTIFTATAQILDTDGAQGLTTNRVAERAGFSIGTLYQYFPNMDAILLAMIDLERRRVVDSLDRLLSAAETSGAEPVDTLRAVVGGLVAALGSGSAARRFLLRRAWAADHTPPAIAAARDGARRLGLYLERCGPPRFPPPDEASLFAATRAVLGVIRAAVNEDSPLLGRPEFEEALVRMVLGLGAAPVSAAPR